jgi:hypothetical protein
MAIDNMKHRRLQELSESDFEIVDGQPDIRGWEVRNGRDQKIGEVDELILDAKERRIRYLIVDLNDNELDLDDREVLIPIGLAELHQEDDDVVLPGISTEQLRSLPEYEQDRLNEETERSISGILGRQNLDTPVSNPSLNSEFYEHDHFNESNLYKRRLLPEHTTSTDETKTRRMSLQERMEQSGNEVEGYLGSDTRKRNRLTGSLENAYSEEESEEFASISSNRNADDNDELISGSDKSDNPDDLFSRSNLNTQNHSDTSIRPGRRSGDKDESEGREITY